MDPTPLTASNETYPPLSNWIVLALMTRLTLSIELGLDRSSRSLHVVVAVVVTMADDDDEVVMTSSSSPPTFIVSHARAFDSNDEGDECHRRARALPSSWLDSIFFTAAGGGASRRRRASRTTWNASSSRGRNHDDEDRTTIGVGGKCKFSTATAIRLRTCPRRGGREGMEGMELSALVFAIWNVSSTHPPPGGYYRFFHSRAALWIRTKRECRWRQ